MAVTEELLNAAGLPPMYRDALLAHGDRLKAVADQHHIKIDYAYKVRQRAKQKLEALVAKLQNGELEDLANKVQQLASAQWETTDNLKWGKSPDFEDYDPQSGDAEWLRVSIDEDSQN